MSDRINLASRPFRNERPRTLLAALGMLALVAVTVKHTLALRDLLSRQTTAADQEVEALSQELDALHGSLARLRVPDPDREQLADWRVVEELVDRRTFSWTALLSLLEEVVPREVRLVSISPQTSSRELRVELVAVARSQEAALGFFGQLEARPEFSQVYPKRLAAVADGTELQVSMGYHPPGLSAAEVDGGQTEAAPDAEPLQESETEARAEAQAEEGGPS